MANQTVLAIPERQAATLLDLRLQAAQVAELLAGETSRTFLADPRLRHATMFNLVRIAETVRKLPTDVLTSYPGIDWSSLGRFTAQRSYEMAEAEWPDAWRIAADAVPALLDLNVPSTPDEIEPAGRPAADAAILHIDLPEDELADFRRRWRIAELAVFGSALRDDFHPDSDVDFLVTFDAEAAWSLFDQLQMQEELATILGREVDLIERSAVESSPNWIRRRAILSTARPVRPL